MCSRLAGLWMKTVGNSRHVTRLLWSACLTIACCLLQRQPQGPNVSLRDARYPYEIALPIENIEGLLRDDAAKYRLQVEQPWIPTDLVILPEEVGKPSAHTVRVRSRCT